MKSINYLDLFSGIGGFALGFQQAEYAFEWHGHSEINKYAERIYHEKFKESVCLGDIKTINPHKLPHLDLLTFGFPCQDLSVAGKRGGIHAERSGLFFEAMRIIRVAKPKVFVFENVKGLLSSNKGKDFETVLREIADIGIYDCEWQLVNTRWVLPQNRERIYFIGHLRGKSKPKVFPFTENQSEIDDRYKKIVQKERTIKSNGGGGGQSVFYAIYKRPHNYKINGRLSKYPNLRSNSSSENNELLLDPNLRIRRLTPLECERLQGFPDNWTNGLSDSARYRVLGNAVSVPIIKMIAERLQL